MKAALQTMVLHSIIEEEGASEALKKVHEIGYPAAEISGHFRCDDQMVEEFCRARKEWNLQTCSLNVVYTGGFSKDAILPGGSIRSAAWRRGESQKIF